MSGDIKELPLVQRVINGEEISRVELARAIKADPKIGRKEKMFSMVLLNMVNDQQYAEILERGKQFATEAEGKSQDQIVDMLKDIGIPDQGVEMLKGYVSKQK